MLFRSAAVVLAPPLHILVRIAPQQIADDARVGHVGRPRNATDLIHAVVLRRQAAVDAEDLLVDDGGDGKTVEAVGERLPKFDVVPALALVVETVDAVDARALVVAAQQEKVLRVLHLVRQQQTDRLERLRVVRRCERAAGVSKGSRAF